jgi:hypothetical protein
MRMRARHGLALWGAALLALAGCEMAAPPAPPAPAPPPATRPAPAPSETSAALAAHYARIERDLLNRGLLRSDGGGPDTPWTDTDLMRNFETIVFFDEYRPGAGFRPSGGQSGALRSSAPPCRPISAPPTAPP